MTVLISDYSLLPCVRLRFLDYIMAAYYLQRKSLYENSTNAMHSIPIGGHTPIKITAPSNKTLTIIFDAIRLCLLLLTPV